MTFGTHLVSIGLKRLTEIVLYLRFFLKTCGILEDLDPLPCMGIDGMGITETFKQVGLNSDWNKRKVSEQSAGPNGRAG
jgi:hypothetical protein